MVKIEIPGYNSQVKRQILALRLASISQHKTVVHYDDQFQDSVQKVSARLIWIYTVCKGYTKVYRLLFTFSKLQMQLNGYAP